MKGLLDLASFCVISLMICSSCGNQDNPVFTNKFAIRFQGDLGNLEQFARDHGYINHGQIGSLENHYLLEHPHVYKRSLRHNEHHHEKLRSHPDIQWFEQQKILSRKKRDFIEMPHDLLEAERELQGSISRSKREARQNFKWEIKREMPDLKFNDPLYPKMWYYNGGGLNHTDMNVMGAWKRGVTGKNVVITILDDGIERTHDDLKDNYDPYASYDVNGKDSDPMPRYDYTNENRHGTRCAGEVSAKANNSFCVVGVAYDSKIGGVRMLDGEVYDAVEAESLSHNRSHIDIYSASWGPDDDGRVVDGPGELAKAAFIDGVRLGRKGKGSIFVWASGNGGNTKDSCNCDGYTNSIYTLSISSISQHGRKPWYLEECSSTLATTYSSGTYNEKQIGRKGKGAIFIWASGNGGRMTDSCSCDGYTNSIYTLSISGISQRMQKPFYLEECASTIATTFSSGSGSEQKVITVDLHDKCTETHTGTSASAPLAAGIVALTLEVNPSLTWRDVQYITLMTARPLPDGVWVTNAVGRKVSLRYGYGLMDATAMVELAEKWTTVPAQHKCSVQSEVVDARIKDSKLQFPDSGYEEMLDTEACAGSGNAINYLEHVLASFTIKGKRRGDLVIHLTSPMGTKSTILPQRPNDGDRSKGFNKWAFLSVHFWGENPVGRWKLQIEVKKSSRSFYGGNYAGSQKTNDLIDWSLILYGTEENPVNLVQPTPPTVKPGTEGVSTPSPVPTTPTTLTPTTTNTPIQSTVTQIPVTVSSTELSHINVTETCSSQCLGGCKGPGADKCDSCKNYQMQDSGVCVQACPNNYYAQDFLCKKCNEECDTCTLITANRVMCLRCKAGYLLVEGKGTCRTFCEKGYYKDNIAHHCRVCSGHCAECSDKANNCTACRWGMELQKDTCVPEKIPCPAGHYKVNSNCLECPKDCFTCTSATNCTCCKESYLQEGSCVNNCDTNNGYIPFHVNYSSEFVFQQCQHCDKECQMCPDGFKKVKGICVQQSNCPEGMYFQWNSMSCKLCNASCKTCIGPGARDCLSCYAPLGYHSSLRKCMPCCSQREKSLGSKHCCPCVEEGKCDLRFVSGIPSHSNSINVIIVVFIVIVICALVIFTIVFCVIYHQKKLPRSTYSYRKLQDSDKDLLEEALT